MYPNLYYAFKDLLGVEWSFLRFVNSFGFFVALAFLSAAYVLTQELRRKERMGLMHATDHKLVVGKGATAGELILNFILGFLLGYKILGLFFLDEAATVDPQAFIFSTNGHLPAGIFLGLVFAGIKYWEKNKQKLSKPEERVIRIWPHDRVGDLVIIAAIFGFLGAKIFHNLENWDEFSRSPIEALLSFSGLTFYGGLIFATAVIIYYARRHRMSVRHLADCFGPAMMLAYAVGRIGCQVAGDGDWGIMNSAYVSTPDGKVVAADSALFESRFNQYKNVYLGDETISHENQLRYEHVPAPSWVPDWLVAYNYPHNVINEGVPIDGCTGPYCRQLPLPVFPTPFYETVFCLLLTVLLFALRKPLVVPGTLFAVYLFLNGLERFFIEKIRVNTQYNFNGFQPTQAELISSFLMLTGIVLFVFLYKKRKREVRKPL